MSKNLRPDLKAFMDSVGLDETVLTKTVDPMGKAKQNTGQPQASSAQGIPQTNPNALMNHINQQMRQTGNQLVGKPHIPANQGGIIVKGEIRVDEKYVDNVNKVMDEIKHAVAIERDEDGDLRLTDEQASFVEEMMNHIQVKPAGTGTVLDQALVQEMGKAYKERFEIAKAAGDEVNMNRAYGSMVALKKVMEMLN